MITWNPPREAFVIPGINHPVAWYGILFALGFYIGFYIFVDLYSRHLKGSVANPKEHARKFTEKLTLYVLVGTLVGARLGEAIFYDEIWTYLSDPLRLFRTWEGGLSSHGGVVGILIALYFFKRKVALSWTKLIDFLAIPTAFAGGCIRLGNFVNQEILGVATSVPWSVVFLDPLDGSPAVPRHPVQLYEALFYFGTCFALYLLYRKSGYRPGQVGGLFFIAVFSFRFLIEALKEEQSRLMGAESLLKMGQYLSIPCILFGCYLLWRGKAQERAAAS